MSSHLKTIKQRLTAAFGEPATLNELAQLVIDAINAQKDDTNKFFQVAGFKWDIRYDNSVSNSHDCPANGVTNWGGWAKLADGSPAPRGYPGYVGRVWIRYARPIKTFGSNPFSSTLTHTGTSGAGAYYGPWDEICKVRYRTKKAYPWPIVCSWDYRIFIDDWPLIKKAFEQEKIVAALTNKKYPTNHVFEWQDPEFAKRDQEFIKQNTKQNEPAN